MDKVPAEVLELERLWTSQELADYYDVPIATVLRAAKRGSIPGCIKSIGHYVFDKDVAVAGWAPAKQVIEEVGYVEPRTLEVRPSEEVYLSSLGDAVEGEIWSQICERAAEQAVGGDRYARKWLSDYLMGIPVHRVSAEIGIVTRKKFSDEHRAAVVTALLELAKERGEEASDPDSNGEESDRRPGAE